MKYYSIRVIQAESIEQATIKVEENDFDENDTMCDKIIPESEVSFLDTTQSSLSHLLFGEEACRILCENDFETLVSEIENNNIGYALYKYDGNLPELLNELSGWGDYAFLDEQQFNILSEQ